MFLGIFHTYPRVPDPNWNVEPGNGPDAGVCGPKINEYSEKLYTGNLAKYAFRIKF